jgi:hypothetical protein
VITSSNGYTNASIAQPAGYSSPTPLGNAAIDVPPCQNTYLGVKIFTSGPFDASLCAAACSATSEYNTQQGIPQTCQFFDTYVLYDEGRAVGQYCAMYSQSYDASYATNVGQYRGDDYYTIGYSYTFSNASYSGSSSGSTC